MGRIITPWQEVQDGALWPVLPFAFMAGILVADYEAMRAIRLWPLLLMVAGGLVLLSKFLHWRWRHSALILAVFLLGGVRLGWGYAQNDTRVLTHRYFGPVEGRVVNIDQSHSGKLRLTLADVRLDGRAVFGKVRMSLHGMYGDDRVVAGAIMQTTGHLSPPNGPSEPGGYDFRKRAWLDGIAAVGYTKNPAIFSDVEERGWREWVLDKRLKQAEKLRIRLGDVNGGFAAAIFVGDKSELDPALVEAMRNSNLAHLLAISGMHMGTVCALAFLSIRRISGWIPQIANTIWPKRLAIAFALIITTVYWLFSGMAYSATRAFFMSVLFFAALGIGRKAISLRSLALVAIGILIYDPMAVQNIGFQMSFAATMALVVGFENVPVYYWPLRSGVRWLVILLFTSFVAALATAPFGAFHFNQIPKYGLLANMLAVPVMSFVVMPAMILWVLLEPFGWHGGVAILLDWGLSWIGWVARIVSGFDAPVWSIGAANVMGFALVLLGGILFALWRALAAMFLIILGVLIWPMRERPDIFVAESARFFAVEIGEERRFSRSTGHSFLAEIWSKRDGQAFDQEQYALGIENDFALLELDEGWRLVFTTTKKGALRIAPYCVENTLILAAQADRPFGDCMFFNEKDLREAGGLAIKIHADGLDIRPFNTQKRTPWYPDPRA